MAAAAPLHDALEAGLGFYWVGEQEILVVPSPALFVDTTGRPHRETGPAIEWTAPDGEKYHFWHGVRVGQYVVEEPHKISVELIQHEHNIEVRRVMIERYGEDLYIADSGMKPVSHDERFGTLYVQHFDSGRPIARIKVTNRSKEPDGSYRHYFLPVNPALYDGDAGKYPQAAVASTWRTKPGGKELFFRNWRDYAPRIET